MRSIVVRSIALALGLTSPGCKVDSPFVKEVDNFDLSLFTLNDLAEHGGVSVEDNQIHLSLGGQNIRAESLNLSGWIAPHDKIANAGHFEDAEVDSVLVHRISGSPYELHDTDDRLLEPDHDSVFISNADGAPMYSSFTVSADDLEVEGSALLIKSPFVAYLPGHSSSAAEQQSATERIREEARKLTNAERFLAVEQLLQAQDPICYKSGAEEVKLSSSMEGASIELWVDGRNAPVLGQITPFGLDTELDNEDRLAIDEVLVRLLRFARTRGLVSVEYSS